MRFTSFVTMNMSSIQSDFHTIFWVKNDKVTTLFLQSQNHPYLASYLLPYFRSVCQNGLNKPTSVERSTRDYRQDCDPYVDFWTERMLYHGKEKKYRFETTNTPIREIDFDLPTKAEARAPQLAGNLA